MFVHLHCHSYYSFLRGASAPEALLEQAARLGLKQLALTDREGLYGAVAFARRAEAMGIRPIVGAELPLDGVGGVVALPRSAAGYAALCRALTRFHLDPAFDPAAALEALAEDNWLLFAEPRGLAEALRRCRTPHLVAELVDHGRPADRARNRALIELARRHGLPAAATNAVGFATPGDWDTHRLLTAIRLRSTLGKLGPDDTAAPDAWLKPPAQMAALFRECPEALAATERIAESCEFRFPSGATLHPPFPLPAGESAFSLLWKRAFAGAARRYRPLTPAVIARLERELEVIRQMGYAEYFLIVRDLVEFAETSGIPTVGRGSAAGSLTAYALGVTHVDPLALNLSFERFLNLHRTDPPDIDLDFCWRRRHEVIRYLYQKYGADNAAMLATFVTLAGRGALRESARAIGMPEREISRFTRPIPHHAAGHIDTVLREIPECRNIPFHLEPYATVIRLAKTIAGHPRHLGLHPCGIVLSRVPLHEVVPLQMTASGFAATQFDMREAEDVGLLKIDILGQRSLSVIADALDAVACRTGRRLDFSQAPPADPATWRIVQAGRTMGCFQIESPGMRSLLLKLVPRDMETIIAASSVIRPGPADAGMLREFIARYHGRRAVAYLHPALEPILGTTLGVMVYQEDILRVAEAVAGITPGEADKLRRAMSSKRSAEAMRALRDAFLEKAVARGTAPETAAEIWRQMETFSGYAFCKAHSASYAALSWQAAYLKAHHPAEFFAAVLANGGGFYGAAAYVLEARRWGIPVRLPHINRSGRDFAAEGRAVRVGLARVRDLNAATVDRILAARRAGPFVSFVDFLARVPAERIEVERLIRCGALDCFEFSRPELLWRLEVLYEPVKRRRETPGERTLAFDDMTALVFPDAITPRIPDFTPLEKLRQEAEVLGLYVSDHPLALHREELGPLALDRAADIPRRPGARMRLAGWLVTSRRVFTKTREYMKFLTLEDESDIFEAVLFPAVYRRWGDRLGQAEAYLVEGRVTEEFGSFAVEAARVTPLGKCARSAGTGAGGPDAAEDGVPIESPRW